MIEQNEKRTPLEEHYIKRYNEDRVRFPEDAKAIDEMMKILKLLNIDLIISGCGCNGSPYIKFIYKGELITETEAVCVNTQNKLYPMEFLN